MARTSGIGRARARVGAGLLLALGLGLGCVTALQAATPECARLCTAWQLDEAASGDPVAAINVALAGYKEEKLRRRPAPPSDLAGLARSELDDSLGPLRQRPQREELREQLTHLLVIPQQLRVRVEGDEVLIDEGRGAPRRFDPDEPYSRIDALGTAKISAQWQHGSFVIREGYKRSRNNRETYVVDPHGDRLVVTRSVERPAMPDLILRSVYRPLATP
jgi:hypothetical protein